MARKEIKRKFGIYVYTMVGWSPSKKMSQNTAKDYRKRKQLARVVKMLYEGRQGYGVFVALNVKRK